jgi:hypothetical protein
MGVRGQRQAPPLSTPRKNPVPIVQEAGWAAGLQDRSGEVRKISPAPGFDLRIVQPLSSSYTDWATRPTRRSYIM